MVSASHPESKFHTFAAGQQLSRAKLKNVFGPNAAQQWDRAGVI
jgi:hypothetical protein